PFAGEARPVVGHNDDAQRRAADRPPADLEPARRMPAETDDCRPAVETDHVGRTGARVRGDADRAERRLDVAARAGRRGRRIAEPGETDVTRTSTSPTTRTTVWSRARGRPANQLLDRTQLGPAEPETHSLRWISAFVCVPSIATMASSEPAETPARLGTSN